MRIARLVQYFQPRFGYAEYYLMTELAKQGHEVCIITSDHYSQSVKSFDKSIDVTTECGKFIENGLTVYRLPTVFENGQLIASRNLKRSLKDFEPDVLHSNDLFYPSTLLAICYKKLGYRLFVDSITGTFNPRGFTLLGFDLYRLLFKHYLKDNVDGFFAISKGSKKWLKKNFGIPYDSIGLIPLGADDRLFFPSTIARESTRSALGLSDDEILIIYTGKLLPEKDIDVLIKSVAQLESKTFKLRLLLVGSGPLAYMRYLTRLVESRKIRKNVMFISTVARTELPKYYNAADIAVWPGSPSISIIEAMSTGLPIIIASYPKPREDAYDTSHLIEYSNGLDFQRGHVSQLASSIESLAFNEDLRNEMRKKSRKLVEQKINWATIATQYLKIYENPPNSRV